MNPSAGKLSRTASFSASGLEDLRAVEHILQKDNGEEEAKRVVNYCCTVGLLQVFKWKRHCFFPPSPVLSTVFTFGVDS